MICVTASIAPPGPLACACVRMATALLRLKRVESAEEVAEWLKRALRLATRTFDATRRPTTHEKRLPSEPAPPEPPIAELAHLVRCVLEPSCSLYVLGAAAYRAPPPSFPRQTTQPAADAHGWAPPWRRA